MPAQTPGEATTEAAALFGVLANIDRLKVVSAVALGAGGIDQIVAASGVDQRTVERALSRLVAAGVVVNDAGLWRVGFGDLADLARAAAEERSSLEAGPEGVDATIRRFFRGGRVKAIPVAHGRGSFCSTTCHSDSSPDGSTRRPK